MEENKMIKGCITVKVNNPDIEVVGKAVNGVREQYPDYCVYGFRVDNDTDCGIFFSTNENNSMNVKFKKLDERAELPKYAHDGDMGLDVKAISVEYDSKTDEYVYHTGIAMECEKGKGAFGFVRSSNGKTDCYLSNMVGVLDFSIYRGEILAKFKCRTSYEVRCMLEHWKYMNLMTAGVKFDNDETVGNTVEEMEKKVKDNPFKIPDPMDFKPYDIGDKIGRASCRERV